MLHSQKGLNDLYDYPGKACKKKTREKNPSKKLMGNTMLTLC